MTHNNMNIEGQLFYHNDAAIVANREALESLKRVIDLVLMSDLKMGFLKAFDSSGEGYKLCIELVGDEEFVKLTSPADKAVMRDSNNSGEPATIEKDENGKAIIVKNGKVVGRQG